MKTKYLPLMILLMLGIGCKKQVEIGEKVESLRQQDLKVTLNSRNPYSVANMRRAFAKLMLNDIQLINNDKPRFAKGTVAFAQNNTLATTINRQMTVRESTLIAANSIHATHYYIKFMPANDADYSKLKMDSNLLVYPFPLDNENAVYPNNYRDPAVPEGVPTYQYA